MTQLCNLLETELRCLPSSQLGSQLRTRPRAHDRCLLTYPAIFNLFFQNSCRPRKTSLRSATKVRWTSVPNALEKRQPFREGLRFIKDSESSTTRRDLFDNFLFCIRSPSHLSRLYNSFNYLHVVRKQEDCIRLDCNREAVRLSYCQLERIHARARVDMSMLDTGKTAFNAASGLMVPF